MSVKRDALKNDQLVYVLLANKQQKYPLGRSRIVYIGRTMNGLARMAGSTAYRAIDVLHELRGVDEIEVRWFSAQPKPGVRDAWKKLERAFLLVFREEFGEVPKCNVHGKGFTERANDWEYFTYEGVKSKISSLG
jgi:hypothetical protein